MKLTANTLTIILLVYVQVCFNESSQVARGTTVSSDVTRMMSTSSAMQAAARNAVVASLEAAR